MELPKVMDVKELQDLANTVNNFAGNMQSATSAANTAAEKANAKKLAEEAAKKAAEEAAKANEPVPPTTEELLAQILAELQKK